MPKLRLLALPVAAAALLAAGCGSSGGSDSGATASTDWADGLCSAISTWTTSLQSTVNGLKGGNLTKDSLTSAVGEAKASTKQFTDSLDSLGKPNTDAGAKAKESVDTLSSEIKTDIQTIQDAVDNASGLTGVVNAVKVIQQTISKAGTQVSSTLTSFQDIDAKGELEKAFNDAPGCKKLTGGS